MLGGGTKGLPGKSFPAKHAVIRGGVGAMIDGNVVLPIIKGQLTDGTTIIVLPSAEAIAPWVEPTAAKGPAALGG